jgi:nitrite reductase (NADH) small subunit
MPPAATPPGRWLRVASIRDLDRSGRLRVQREDLDILIATVGGVTYACDNTCAHQHFARLHCGMLNGCLLTCPMHGWTFDLRTGISATGEGRIATYPVSLRGDDILIALE